VHNTWEHLKETYYKFNTVMEQFATMGGSYSDADAISRPSMGSLMWELG
jgi:hypothetical protein